RNAHDHEQPLLPPTRSEAAVPWALWRQDLKTYYRSLAADEAWAIDAVLAAQSFAQICDGLCRWHDEDRVATHAAGMLKRWVGDGMIRSLALS
ncbi:MAG: hypothetical protein ACREUA_10685, partial [Burkholderiales bacterium]